MYRKKLIATVMTSLLLLTSPTFSFSQTQITVNNQNNTYHGELYDNNGKLQYSGQLKNGKSHGKGMKYSYYNSKGSYTESLSFVSYEGTYNDGKKEGVGIERTYDYGSGIVDYFYVGAYKNGKMDGLGAKFSFGNLDFIGEMKNDKYEGWGLNYNVGTFESEQITNPSMLITKDKNKVNYPIPTRSAMIHLRGYYKGQSKEGEEIIEEDMLEQARNYDSSNSRYYETLKTLRYEGEYKNGLREGYGKLYNKDGQLIYAGGWENDKIHGFGVSFYDDKVSYVGELREGHIEGLGVHVSGWTSSDHSAEYYIYVSDNSEKKEKLWSSEYLKGMKTPIPFVNLEEKVLKNNNKNRLKINKDLDIKDLDENKLKEIVKDYDKLSKEFKNYGEELKQIEIERAKNRIPSA